MTREKSCANYDVNFRRDGLTNITRQRGAITLARTQTSSRRRRVGGGVPAEYHPRGLRTSYKDTPKYGPMSAHSEVPKIKVLIRVFLNRWC